MKPNRNVDVRIASKKDSFFDEDRPVEIVIKQGNHSSVLNLSFGEATALSDALEELRSGKRRF